MHSFVYLYFVRYHMRTLTASIPHLLATANAAHIMSTWHKQTVIFFLLTEFASIFINHFSACISNMFGIVLDSTDISNCSTQFNEHLILNIDFGTGDKLWRYSKPSTIRRSIIFNVKIVVVESNFTMHSTHVLVLSLEIVFLPTAKRKLII